MMFTKLRGLCPTATLLFWITSTFAQKLTEQQLINANRTVSIGIILFPGFEPLDVYGPLSILYELSASYNMTLSTIASKTGPVSNGVPPFHMDGDMSKPPSSFDYMIAPATIATHTFWDAPALDVVLVPGGFGSAALREHNDTDIETFLSNRYPQVEYVMSVCTGAMHLAYAGILKGKKATTNKALWPWVIAPAQSGPGTADIDWQPVARWVETDKVWTSSGVQAGMDMMYAWLRHFYGDTDKVKAVMNGIEYAPHREASWDPFAVVHDVPGTDKNRTVAGCVAPVGYEAACS